MLITIISDVSIEPVKKKHLANNYQVKASRKRVETKAICNSKKKSVESIIKEFQSSRIADKSIGPRTQLPRACLKQSMLNMKTGSSSSPSPSYSKINVHVVWVWPCLGQHIDKRGIAKGIKKVVMVSLAQ